MAKRRKKHNSANSDGSAAPQNADLPTPDHSAEPEAEVAVAKVDAEPGVQPDSSASPSPEAKVSVGFFRSTQEELGKVVWPDRQQLISESIAVILMVSLSAILISFIDGLFRWGSGLIFG